MKRCPETASKTLCITSASTTSPRAWSDSRHASLLSFLTMRTQLCHILQPWWTHHHRQTALPVQDLLPLSAVRRKQTKQFFYQVLVACDLKSKYICNALPYLGKNPSRPSGEGINITTDNSFTFLSLAQRLLGQKTTPSSEQSTGLSGEFSRQLN